LSDDAVYRQAHHNAGSAKPSHPEVDPAQDTDASIPTIWQSYGDDTVISVISQRRQCARIRHHRLTWNATLQLRSKLLKVSVSPPVNVKAWPLRWRCQCWLEPSLSGNVTFNIP